ncbi:MAG: hypothetical protein ABI240_01965 [Sphingomonas sp.]
MSRLLIPALILLALTPGASAQESRFEEFEVAQLTLHQRIIIRIPRLPFTRAHKDDPPEGIRWEEKKGPKCVPMVRIEGALLSGPDSVDLIVEDGNRVRAKLDKNCPSLDFYSGFYLKPTADGMVCASRDSFRTRSGGSCGIDQFKRLVVKR